MYVLLVRGWSFIVPAIIAGFVAVLVFLTLVVSKFRIDSTFIYRIYIHIDVYIYLVIGAVHGCGNFCLDLKLCFNVFNS